MSNDFSNDSTTITKEVTIGGDVVSMQYRRCTTCKQFKVLDHNVHRKNCEPCREKNREKNRRAAKRRQERNQHLATLFQSDSTTLGLDSAPAGVHVTSNKKENFVPQNMTVREAIKAKRRSKPLRDLEGEEQRQALKMMKHRLNDAVDARPVKKPRISNPHPVADPLSTEYQAASSLYEAIKVSLLDKPKKPQFRGCHSIITMPSIDNEKRAGLVVTDLRKLTRLHFEHASPSSTTSKSDLHSVTYKCNCLGHKTVQPPTKKAGSGLMHWARVMKREQADAAAGDVKVRVECNGTVQVVVHDDTSHPHGIPGQRIQVVVEHVKTKVV